MTNVSVYSERYHLIGICDMIEFVEDRKGHDYRYAIDPTKIKEELGWYPKTKFEAGIVKTIDWYLENKDWLK